MGTLRLIRGKTKMILHDDDNGNLVTRDGLKIRVSAGELSQVNGITATGTTQDDAIQVSGDINVITVCASGSGIRLPVPQAGVMTRIVVVNKGANALLIYPHVGGYLNAGVINAASSLAADGAVDLASSSGSQWYSV